MLLRVYVSWEDRAEKWDGFLACLDLSAVVEWNSAAHTSQSLPNDLKHPSTVPLSKIERHSTLK